MRTDLGEAVGLCAECSLRILGLLVLVAEAVVPRRWRHAREYVAAQRRWLGMKHDEMELAEAVDDVFGGEE